MVARIDHTARLEPDTEGESHYAIPAELTATLQSLIAKGYDGDEIYNALCSLPD